MSYIMCDLESRVLTEALAAVKVVPNVRMFDGFMLDADTKLSPVTVPERKGMCLCRRSRRPTP